jgi:multisubunit Na+/H+ antiporter MnhC subunit
VTILLATLAGLLVAGGVYLLLAAQTWQRLAGIVLLGQALPLLLLANGGLRSDATAAGLIVALLAFGLFLAEAARLHTACDPASSRSEAQEGP